MKPVVVVSDPFNGGIRGGVISTHKLVRLLNDRGVEAYVYNSKGDTMPQVKEAPDSLINSRDFTAIYPEGWDRNYLRAKNAHCWLLHFPRKEYLGFDHFWHFEGAYAIPQSKQLKVVDINLNEYCNDGNPRKGVAYVYHKNALARQMDWADDMGWDDPLCLDGANPYDGNLAAYFNSREMFYSYDPYSFYSILAAACGCRSVVHPIPDVSKEQYKEHLRQFGSFLCYGIEDKVEEQETKARAALLEQAEMTERQIDELISTFS
jgi:hypothetical protein